jgi:hypothetical protein
MRALGIPNNKNFFEVTQMKDALELWASIQVRAARQPLLPCHHALFCVIVPFVMLPMMHQAHSSALAAG